MNPLFCTMLLVSLLSTTYRLFACTTNNVMPPTPKAIDNRYQQEFYLFINGIISKRTKIDSNIMYKEINDFIASGVDINGVYFKIPSYFLDPQSRTMLQQVLLTDAKNYRLIKTLIMNGAQVNARNDAGQTALHFAVKYADPKVVEYLCNQPQTDINAIDNEGMTPLASCVIDIDRFFNYSVGIDGDSPNMCYANFIAIPTILLRYGAYIDRAPSPIDAIQKTIINVDKNPLSALSPQMVQRYKEYNRALIDLLLTTQKERVSTTIRQPMLPYLTSKQYAYIIPKQ